MTDQHPITIPPDLEEELLGLWPQEALQRAAQWGWQQRDANVPSELQQAQDEELDACCEWLRQFKPEGYLLASRLSHRRFKPKRRK